MFKRQYSLLDQLVIAADQALQSLQPDSASISRPSPAEASSEAPDNLSATDKQAASALMRVNHTGEVCAQALYHGQSITAELEGVRVHMEQAAQEEEDHLAWCGKRLTELGSQPSRLNPLFYGMSFGIGLVAGAAGDRWSLGFVAETEKQVCIHLEEHITKLPANDVRSRAILTQMRDDEWAHQQSAQESGGAQLPGPIRSLMAGMAWVMKNTTPYV